MAFTPIFVNPFLPPSHTAPSFPAPHLFSSLPPSRVPLLLPPSLSLSGPRRCQSRSCYSYFIRCQPPPSMDKTHHGTHSSIFLSTIWSPEHRRPSFLLFCFSPLVMKDNEHCVLCTIPSWSSPTMFLDHSHNIEIIKIEHEKF